MAKYDSLINDAKRAKGIPADKTISGLRMYTLISRHTAAKKVTKDPELFDNINKNIYI